MEIQLYSFRRCPYAMRARMALIYSKIKFIKHEVDLKNKPAEMLNFSPKGTVPVLVIAKKQVIDESMDIINWCLQKYDPKNLQFQDQAEQATFNSMIQYNDQTFKNNLDRYKYPNRYTEVTDTTKYQQAIIDDLKRYNNILKSQPYLTGQRETVVDLALFPFIRQAIKVDVDEFNQLQLTYLNHWLNTYINSDIFTIAMQKS